MPFMTLRKLTVSTKLNSVNMSISAQAYRMIENRRKQDANYRCVLSD